MFSFYIKKVLFLNILINTFLNVTPIEGLSPLDPSSFSRPEVATIQHISLSLNVDFAKKTLEGVAILNFEVFEDTAEVILDESDLSISAIELDNGTALHYRIDEAIRNVGAKLTITLPYPVKSGEKLKVVIKYRTAPTASALQWLNPEQTAGKVHPYLFSQCSPIHARSILPCQDSTAVKFTYDAEVTAPPQYTVLMSALRGEVVGNTTHFQQPVPIPSNLLALVVGVLEYRRLGPRSLVWSEKELIERSAWEFAETESYIQAAEKFCGPYEWTQYDLLVLPPSFPYGGMENPCLTFVTPALLVGDRSLVYVIIHEILHSWTGNLVTQRNFEHFWLKEGFTVFLERKVGASLIDDSNEGKRIRDFHSLLGLQELNETINHDLLPTNPLTRLVLSLKGVHPDDAFSLVPYEKGSLFLRYLEDLLGGPEKFNDFVLAYIKHFRRKSLDSDDFKAFFIDYFKDYEQLSAIDWDTWLHESGMPPVIPDYDDSMMLAVTNLASRIVQGNMTFSFSDVRSFNLHQKISLLQLLLDENPLPIDKMRQLGSVYKLDDSKNAEIAYRLIRLYIKCKDHTKLTTAFEFLNSHGRMKYTRPIYRDLYAWEDVRAQTIENYLNNEPYMMRVSERNLRKDLHLYD